MRTIHDAILHAADRLVFGDMTGAVAVSSPPARGGVWDVGCCPRCRVPLRLNAGPEGLWLYVVED